VALTLYPHQSYAYEAAAHLLAQKGRAAVIHPTGTGKSYIAFKLIESHPSAAFLWLAPSEYIYRVQRENLRRSNPDFNLSNVLFRTYASLLYDNQRELARLHFDYIILDEFHRCGSEHWGAAVQQVLADHSGAKVLGLSATHIRYLDNQRDMAEELFDGCVASKMTLGEAIVRGILPAPKYVTTVYQYQQSLNRYEQRIASIRNQRSRDRSERYLQALRRTMEQAEGLDAVFLRHMTDKHGHYIVFCSSVERMREMVAHVNEWFHAIDASLHCYQVYSENAEASAAYDAFRQDDSNHLKLLFCVNMLNEGIHVEGIAGVILFRPTVSPIIYKQQIGRALTAGGKHTPLILDVVNNVEGLYSISSVQQEMLDAAFRLRAEGLDNLIVTERFRVIDQVENCRKLFEQLEGSLHIDWEEYYQAAAAYRKENGHLLIPQRYVTADGKCLGSWLMTQRYIHNGNKAGKLTAEQELRLEALGIVWDDLRQQSWETNFQQAAAYYREHGDLRVPHDYVTENGVRLGQWLSNVRTRYRKLSAGQMDSRTQEEIHRLESIGMEWNAFDARWEKYYEAAKDYYAEHGDLLVPTGYVAQDGLKLGAWIANQRSKYRQTGEGKLSPTQVKRLNALDMVWDDLLGKRWLQYYDAAKCYLTRYGNLQVKRCYVTPDGLKLGIWLMNQRQNYRNNQGNLKDGRVKLLQEIGIV